MSKISNINKGKQPQTEPKQINLADIPDGDYRITDHKKVAIKQNGRLGIFDVYMLVGNGIKINASVLDREYKLQQENRIVIPGVQMPSMAGK